MSDGRDCLARRLESLQEDRPTISDGRHVTTL
jgi:hypothetical protein